MTVEKNPIGILSARRRGEALGTISRASYEAHIGSVKSLAEGINPKYKVIATFPFHAIVESDEGAFRLTLENRDGKLVVVGTEPVSLPSVTEADVVDEIRKRANEAVEYIIGGKDPLDSILDLTRLMDGPGDFAAVVTAESLGRDLKSTREWRVWLTENTAGVRERLLGEFEAIVASTPRSAYKGVLPEKAKTMAEGISDSLKRLYESVAECSLKLNNALVKIRSTPSNHSGHKLVDALRHAANDATLVNRLVESVNKLGDPVRSMSTYESLVPVAADLIVMTRLAEVEAEAKTGNDEADEEKDNG